MPIWTIQDDETRRERLRGCYCFRVLTSFAGRPMVHGADRHWLFSLLCCCCIRTDWDRVNWLRRQRPRRRPNPNPPRRTKRPELFLRNFSTRLPFSVQSPTHWICRPGRLIRHVLGGRCHYCCRPEETGELSLLLRSMLISATAGWVALPKGKQGIIVKIG
jgi:hypothetical protein